MYTLRRTRTAAVLTALGLAALVAACGGASPATSPPVRPTQILEGIIELELTGDLKIEQAGQQVGSLTVKAGQPYTFRITNTAGFEHDFHIATDAQLQSGGPEAMAGIQPWSSGVKEFTYTFEAGGPLAFGCTVPGHYSVMKGTFTIVP